MEPTDPRTGLPQAKNNTRERAQPHPSENNWILKLYWARPCPPEQDPVFPTATPSHQEAYTSLSASSIRRDRRQKKYNPTVTKTKPHHRKLTSMKKLKVMYQTKGQDKPQKNNWVETGNLPEEELRRVIVRMIQGLRKRTATKTEKMGEMFTKDLEELKNKQTEMNHTPEGMHRRITEAEEQILTWKTEWWKTLP